MAAGAWTLYSNALLNINEGKMNLASDTLVMVLLTGSYTPAPNTDSTWANASAYEVAAGGGYTQGGIALTSQSVATAGGTLTFTSAAVNWASFSATLRYGLIVRRAAASLASTDLLLCYSDFGGGSSITGGGGTFTVTPNASGIFTVTHNP